MGFEDKDVNPLSLRLTPGLESDAPATLIVAAEGHQFSLNGRRCRPVPAMPVGSCDSGDMTMVADFIEAFPANYR